MTIQGGVRSARPRGLPLRARLPSVHPVPSILARRQGVLLQLPPVHVPQGQFQITPERLSDQNEARNLH